MRKRDFYVGVLLLLAVLMAACSGGSDDDPTLEPTEENPPETATPTEEAPPVEPPTVEPTSYPAPPTPTPPGIDAGYPAFTPEPTIDPYPGGLVKVMHPMGQQCEEATLPDLSAAIGSLEEAGIAVVAAEEIALNVCEACSCPTSEHFRVQINVEDLDRALELGWQR